MSGRATETPFRAPPGPVPGSASWAGLARRARRLSWLSLGWLGVEGSVGVMAGLFAGSVALVAFGLDSAIEGLASVIVIWRFTGSRAVSPGAERVAQRVVAVSFFLLAPYVAAEAARALLTGAAARPSWLGVALAAATLAVCPWLGLLKERVGRDLGSAATRGEGRQNMLCAMLAAGVLAGLLANALLGIWWLDPAIALLIAAVCVREGLLAWRGDPCGCEACGAPATPMVLSDPVSPPGRDPLPPEVAGRPRL